MDEADEMLAEQRHRISTCCACAASRSHDEVRSVHRRRTTRCSWSSRTATGSCASLLVNELEIDPAKLVKVLHYDGTPITARFIADAIAEQLDD